MFVLDGLARRCHDVREQESSDCASVIFPNIIAKYRDRRNGYSVGYEALGGGNGAGSNGEKTLRSAFDQNSSVVVHPEMLVCVGGGSKVGVGVLVGDHHDATIHSVIV